MPGLYDLELDTSELTAQQCAAAIAERLRAGIGVRQPLGAGGRIEIVEVQRHLVDGRLRQVDSGAIGVPAHNRPPVDHGSVRFGSHDAS